MTTIWAEHALVDDGWADAVSIDIGIDGRIESVTTGSRPTGSTVGVLLPAPVNLHSHAFQRAMAGMTERRGPTGRDSFWTWRQLMFKFLEALSPEDIEVIAAFVQMEMLEAGYAGVAEFHYVHHQADGTPYDDPAELAARIAAASAATGIGITLLPVLYQQAGCDGAPLVRGQVRFGNSVDQFADLFERARAIVSGLPADAGIGVAPHSLRAVTREGLKAAVNLAPGRPLHMHLAEQTAEVDEVLAAYGRRPVDWLLSNHPVDERWCLIHCTHMTAAETISLAKSRAVAGLCPITESSLGDGIFNGVAYLEEGGRFGIGSDSNIRISLCEELRTLEYSQRLQERRRVVLASHSASTGRVLFENALRGGAQASGRRSGVIDVGAWADLLGFDAQAPDLAGRRGDILLDSFIFAGDHRMITDLWSAGRHVVQDGRHIHRDAIATRYRQTMSALKDRL